MSDAGGIFVFLFVIVAAFGLVFSALAATFAYLSTINPWARPKVGRLDSLWPLLPPETQYVAMDENGQWCWYSSEPEVFNWYWNSDGQFGDIKAPGILELLPIITSDNWRESLIKRPAS